MIARYICFFTLLVLSCSLVVAQNAAPSSHLVFDDDFDGDIIVNQVRVPADGVATYTYYETLGWRGLGAGYAGIQAHPKANNFIFSIWDNKQHTAPIQAVYRGPGTKTEKFGGEGTGLKSWNFELGWKPDTWYTLVSRNWAVDDHRYFGFWARADDTKIWTHLVTMDVAVKDALFQGRTDAFIEDWLDTGKNPRTTHLKGGWKRKLNGQWHAFGSGRYRVNHWDLVKGKRSYGFRTNWNGGIKKDDSGLFYFMTAGGAATVPTTENPSNHTIPVSAVKPNFRIGQISDVVAKRDKQSIVVSWKQPKKSTPQFSVQLEFFDGEDATGKPLLTKTLVSPHGRKIVIPYQGKPIGSFLRISATDIFDQKSQTHEIGF